MMEICARFIGQTLPFELVQIHPQRVPEELQKRIAYWSFPLEEKRLLEYAQMMGISDYQISRLTRDLRLGDRVSNMSQIGEFERISLRFMMFVLIACIMHECMYLHVPPAECTKFVCHCIVARKYAAEAA